MNDNVNPFAVETEKAEGGRTDLGFHDYENPYRFQANAATGETEVSNSGRLTMLQRWNTAVRVITFIFSLGTVCVIFFGKQTKNVYVQISGTDEYQKEDVTLNYKDNGSFTFFLYINLVVCAYALLLVVFAFLMGRKGTGESTPASLLWPAFALNIVAVSFLLLAFAAALAVDVVNRNGTKMFSSHGLAKWVGLCSEFGSFCTILEVALAASAISYTSLMVGTCIDAYFIHKRRSL